MDLYLMRHGETDLNKQFRMQGSVDAPLNTTGRQQASGAGKLIQKHNLRFDKVISSPLDRAQTTAELAAGIDRSRLWIDDRIREIDYGPYDGKRILTLPPKVLTFLISPHKREAPSGIETVEHLYDRVSEFLREVINRPTQEKILVVSHGIAMRAMFGFIQGKSSRELWKDRFAIDNCALFHVLVREQKFSEITLIN